MLLRRVPNFFCRNLHVITAKFRSFSGFIHPMPPPAFLFHSARKSTVPGDDIQAKT
jgi:hypothetical protein